MIFIHPAIGERPNPGPVPADQWYVLAVGGGVVHPDSL